MLGFQGAKGTQGGLPSSNPDPVAAPRMVVSRQRWGRGRLIQCETQCVLICEKGILMSCETLTEDPDVVLNLEIAT